MEQCVLSGAVLNTSKLPMVTNITRPLPLKYYSLTLMAYLRYIAIGCQQLKIIEE